MSVSPIQQHTQSQPMALHSCSERATPLLACAAYILHPNNNVKSLSRTRRPSRPRTPLAPHNARGHTRTGPATGPVSQRAAGRPGTLAGPPRRPQPAGRRPRPSSGGAGRHGPNGAVGPSGRVSARLKREEGGRWGGQGRTQEIWEPRRED
jgi:hypothetical protein